MRIIYLPIILGLISCASQPKVKNVILFIGDGMGPAVVTATRIQYKGKDGSLNMDKLPYTAKVKTYSNGYLVTDSAAAATAMATGNKVESGVLGRDATSSPPKYGGFKIGKNIQGKPVTNLVELASKKGLGTGVVSNNHIFHATHLPHFLPM